MPDRPSLLPQMAHLFAAQARLYCISTGIAGLLGIVSLTAISLFMVHGADQATPDPRALWQSMSFSHQLIAIFGLIFALWTPVLLAARAVCRITAERLSERTIALSDVLADMARFIPAALIYALVIGIPAMIGGTILFIPGMVVASIFVLVIPVAVNERVGIVAALKRGVSLDGQIFVKGLLAVLACGAIIGLLLFLRIAFIDRFLPGSYKSLFAIRFAIIYLPSLLLLVLANICFTLLYHEARARQAPAAPGVPH